MPPNNHEFICWGHALLIQSISLLFFAIATCSAAAQWAKMVVNPAKIETLIFMFSSLF